MSAIHTAYTLDGGFTKVFLNKSCLSMCGNRSESTNAALSISIVPLNKAIFGLGGLGFCKKV